MQGRYGWHYKQDPNHMQMPTDGIGSPGAFLPNVSLIAAGPLARRSRMAARWTRHGYSHVERQVEAILLQAEYELDIGERLRALSLPPWGAADRACIAASAPFLPSAGFFGL